LKRLQKTYGCPVEFSLDLLGGKWKPVILARLKEQPLRYGELRQLVPALSDKVLTENLRDLEERGLILRQAELSGAYELTPLGETLRPVLDALYAWGHRSAPMLGVNFEVKPVAE
jgi:DNA-binding HxlR family transcriptional regulator